MVSRILQSLSLLILVLTFSGCKTKLPNTEPDFLETKVNSLSKNSSIISIPVEIPFKIINEKINNELKGVLYEDLSYDDGDDLMLKVSIYDKIKVSGLKNFIMYNAPVDVWASVRWKACSICPEITKASNFKIEFKFVSQLTLKNNWDIETKTTLTDYEFKQNPMLDIGPVKVNIKSFIDIPLRKEAPKFAETIDKEMIPFLKIKPYVEEVWKEIQKPYLADQNYNLWLLIQPLNFIATQPECSSERLVLRLGLSTHIHTLFGDRPDVKLKSLPPIDIKEKVTPEFKININAFLEYQELTRQAMNNFKDTVLEFSKRKVKIDEIDIFGKSGELFIKTKVSGSIVGELFLKGTPAIDTLKNNLYLKNLDFEYNTKKVLHKSASWILQGTIRKAFEQNMYYQINNDIKQGRSVLESFLNDYDFQGLARFKGKIGRMQLDNVQAEDRGISARFYLDGSVVARITKLDI